MTLKELEYNLSLRDKDVKLKEDAPLSFRIFIYSLMGKRKILTFMDKQREFRVTKISNYPDQGKQYPICVLRVERLRMKGKVVKPKRNATYKS